MKLNARIALLCAALALLLTPAAALAIGPEYAPEEPVVNLPGPGASLKEKTKAYRVYCHGFSKKHAKGQKATPFARCLTAMAKASTTRKTAKVACKGFPKKHVKGKKGTEFSRCVAAAAEAKFEASVEG